MEPRGIFRMSDDQDSQEPRTERPAKPQSTAKKQGLPPKPQRKAAAEAKRDVPAGVSYVFTPNLLKSILEKMITAQKPEQLTQTYLGTVWGFTGGSAKAILPLFKKVGLLGSDSKPTETYSRFRTEGGRSAAALSALHVGFPDIFKRNEHAEHAPENVLADIVVEVTGREKNDQIVRNIVVTFKTFAGYVLAGTTVSSATQKPDEGTVAKPTISEGSLTTTKLGISYNINLVLPATSEIEVFDSIFRSLKQNLLT